jgi:hypothetical protein
MSSRAGRGNGWEVWNGDDRYLIPFRFTAKSYQREINGIGCLICLRIVEQFEDEMTVIED